MRGGTIVPSFLTALEFAGSLVAPFGIRHPVSVTKQSAIIISFIFSFYFWCYWVASVYDWISVQKDLAI